MKRRLFIESDHLDKGELVSSKWHVGDILEKLNEPFIKNVFDEVVDFAWHNSEKAWEAVKRADEIYGDTSLVPLSGYGTYTGSPVVMDTMMEAAIKEKITGKSVIFLRPYDDIEWDGIDEKLLAKAFKKNKLFTVDSDDRDVLVEVDIKALVKMIKEKRK